MYEETLGWPPVAWAVLGVLIALTVLGSGFGAFPLLIVGVILVGVAVAFRQLRIVVDDTTLSVGFGPFRERLPLTRIVACAPTTYRWLEYGGWGIRYNIRHLRRRATLYNVMGDRGRAVEVVLDDGRRVLFSSGDPAAVCQAIRAHRPEISAATTA